MKDKEKNLLQNWLDQLQQESWQLELLISGFAIFGLFELKSYLGETMELTYANFHIDFSLQVSYIMLVVSYLVTQIFIVNLLIHILVRGLWIGAIGLRYVSGDIDYKALKYNEKFIRYYKRKVGTFDNYIIKLEKLASIIFSFTFLLFFVFISIFFFFLVTVLISVIFKKLGLESNDTVINIFNIFWLIIFGLVAFDFTTLGLLKRIKQRHFSSFYLGLYKIVGAITLSFLWRPILLNFLDQKFTKRLLIAIVPYVFLITIIFPNSHIGSYEYFPTIESSPLNERSLMSSRVVNTQAFNSKYYDSMRNPDKTDFKLIQSFSIPSNKVKGPMFEIFIKYTINTERLIKKKDSTLTTMGKIGYFNNAFTSGGFSTRTKKEKKQAVKAFLAQAGTNLSTKRKQYLRDSLYKTFREEDEQALTKNLARIKNIVKQSFSLFIDGKAVPDSTISMDFYIHPNSEEKGMLCFFPINLTMGRHYLTYHKFSPKNNSTELNTFKMTVPFIYLGE